MEEWIARQQFHKSVHQDAVQLRSTIYSIPLPLFLPNTHLALTQTKSTLDPIREEGDQESDLAIETVFSLEKAAGVKYAKGTRGLTCRTCGLTFTHNTEQQKHFSSTYHNFNLKRTLKDKPSVTYEEYMALVNMKKTEGKTVDEDDDSAGEDSTGEAGSEDDASEGEGDGKVLQESESDVESVGEQEGHRYHLEDAEGRIVKVFNNINGAVFQIQPNTIKPWHFSINVALFRPSSYLSRRDWNQHDQVWSEVYQQLQYCRQHPLMAVFILRSGRFAGAIYNNQKEKDPLLIHKVIRRYTVRAKAGGGQSSHDNKGSKAKSMGAQLRRYGEKALKEDVQNILTLWEDHLHRCGLILIAATKPMRGILYESEETANNSALSLLRKEDNRIVYVPFVVDKPTLESANSIRDRCIQVTISSGAMEQPPTEELKASTKKSSSTNKEVKETTTKVERINLKDEEKLIECPFSKDIIAACKLGNDANAKKAIEAILNQFQAETAEDDDESNVERYCQGWKLSSVLNLPESLEDLATPLHIAAASSLSQAVQCLLLAGANPEQVDARGRTPYFLADNKDTRDAFRKARAEVGEEKWQWTRAGVPEPLTDEKITQQKLKEKEKKKRAQQRKKEQKAKDEQEAKDREVSLQLQEQLLKQERAEMEARQKDKAGNCGFCKKSLYKHDFFEVLGEKCCSTDCVAKLRRKLAADAALARFKN